MPTLDDNDFDFAALSDEDLEKLLAEEREKRKHLAPIRKIAVKGKVVSEKKKTPKAAPAGSIEVELD